MSETRAINEIAREIDKDWGEKVNYAARPYLDAMYSLRNITDAFLLDSGKSVVLYFLANASTWRGETARRIKKELRSLGSESCYDTDKGDDEC